MLWKFLTMDFSPTLLIHVCCIHTPTSCFLSSGSVCFCPPSSVFAILTPLCVLTAKSACFHPCLPYSHPPLCPHLVRKLKRLGSLVLVTMSSRSSKMPWWIHPTPTSPLVSLTLLDTLMLPVMLALGLPLSLALRFLLTLLLPLSPSIPIPQHAPSSHCTSLDHSAYSFFLHSEWLTRIRIATSFFTKYQKVYISHLNSLTGFADDSHDHSIVKQLQQHCDTGLEGNAQRP